MASELFWGLVWWMLAISIFNTVQLFWLGLTIYLNAERRNLGVILISSGLWLAMLFFVCHTVILSHELTFFGTQQLDLWWRLGWIPVIMIPFHWYSVILWYNGYWDGETRLFRRHRLPYALIRLWMVGLLALLLFTSSIPLYEEVAQLQVKALTNLNGIPLLFLLYPPFAILAILLPIDALRRPEPSQRMMGDMARQRSHPFLMGAAVLMAVIAIIVTLFIGWIVWEAHQGYSRTFDYTVSPLNQEFRLISIVVAFDVLVSTLIGLTIGLLGKAVVSYEVFTGRTLPRQGLARHWRRGLWLSIGVAVLVAWNLVQFSAYLISLLLLVFLVMAFFTLTGWRSFLYREQLMTQLRPFVTSQSFDHRLLTDEAASRARAEALFEMMCRQLLDTNLAYLTPLGILAPLAGEPLSYPESMAVELPDLSMPARSLIPLDPTLTDGLMWAIALYAERGLIGLLMIGSRRDGGLYAQEDIDIARTTAERIIDMLAGAAMARRLLQLQRQRQVETRVMDLQTRRVLHDDILPTLHMAVLQASSHSPDLVQTLTEAHGKISTLIHAPEPLSTHATSDQRWFKRLQQAITDEFERHFSSLTWHVDEDLAPLDNVAVEILQGAAREVVRNAAIHGRGEDPRRVLNICITIVHGEPLQVVIEDDGVGLKTTTLNHGGSGGGLALHSALLAVIGGSLEAEQPATEGTRVTIEVPTQ